MLDNSNWKFLWKSEEISILCLTISISAVQLYYLPEIIVPSVIIKALNKLQLYYCSKKDLFRGLKFCWGGWWLCRAKQLIIVLREVRTRCLLAKQLGANPKFLSIFLDYSGAHSLTFSLLIFALLKLALKKAICSDRFARFARLHPTENPPNP